MNLKRTVFFCLCLIQFDPRSGQKTKEKKIKTQIQPKQFK